MAIAFSLTRLIALRTGLGVGVVATGGSAGMGVGGGVDGVDAGDGIAGKTGDRLSNALGEAVRFSPKRVDGASIVHPSS